MKNLTLFLLITFLLIGCSNSNEKSSRKGELNSFSNEMITINNQEFEIVPFFNEYAHYIDQEYANEDEEIRSYSDTILRPIGDALYENEYSLYSDPHLVRPTDLRKLKESLNELNKQFPHIKEHIEDALSDATDLLAGGSYNLFILPFNPDNLYASQFMDGVSGFSTGELGSIAIFIDPFQYSVESLKATVVHEYHHTVLLQNDLFEESERLLLDWVLIEGKAEAFTKTIYPQYDSNWLDPLSPETGSKVWAFIKEKSEKPYRPENLESLYLGSNENGFPELSNYRMGYQIMSEFLKKHPDMSVNTWTYMDSLGIIEDLDIDSWYD